ncbi:protein of unknown function [Pseudomonas sp. JV551A1]|uniref:Uncharacterized protein n=1 Tax=Pseudomonas inefficax TaxID=2078786 RepID=A0AAQ1SRQ1_9PSED|nr:protein of unknown function [Pseudomonas sp. JV551A1]SPO58833.1 protein of unknown function [Pseudomonas inefficax]
MHLWERVYPRTAQSAARLCRNPEQYIRGMKLNPHRTACCHTLPSQPIRLGKRTQRLPITQRQPDLSRPINLCQHLFHRRQQAIATRFGLVLVGQQPHPPRLEQRHHHRPQRQLKPRSAVVGDQRLDLQPTAQRQADTIMPALTAQAADLALQLIACAGTQHQPAEQVEVAGLLGRFENLRLKGLQPLIQAQHPLAFRRQAGTTATTPPGTALHQGLAGQVVEFVDGVPGGLVADARSLGGAGDRTLFGYVLQQRDALGAAGDVLGEVGGQGHGYWVIVSGSEV